jgi:DNA-binding NarL/FixJ family response regulator
MVEVLIVEDHEHLAMGLELIFNGSPDFHVAALATDIPDAVRYLREKKVGLVILDLNLPGGSGLDLLPQLRGLQPEARIIIFSQEDPIVLGPIAKNLGAHGYLRKGASLATILAAAKAVITTTTFFDGIPKTDVPSTGSGPGQGYSPG